MMLRQLIFRTFALAAFATTSCSVWADVEYPGPTLDRSSDIAGPDLDGNGVRDDLDDYVASLPDTESQKRALRQGFRTLRQAILIDTADKNAVLDVMKKSSASVWCIYSQYDSDAGKKSNDVEKYSINTKARFKAYAAFNSAASGHSAVMPRGDGCEPD